MENCPALGTPDQLGEFGGAVYRELDAPDDVADRADPWATWLRHGPLCARIDARGLVDLTDHMGHLGRLPPPRVSGPIDLDPSLGPADEFRRSPSWAVWCWRQGDLRITQSLLLSDRPTAAIVQWRLDGPPGSGEGVRIQTPDLGNAPPDGLMPGTPITVAVWRPPSAPGPRKVLERLIREPAALWKRWTSRLEEGLTIEGDRRIVVPLGLALASLPAPDRRGLWVGVRDGAPAPGEGLDAIVASLALAAAGRCGDALGILSGVLPGDPDDRRKAEAVLGSWTGTDAPEGDLEENPVRSLILESSSNLSRAVLKRETDDLAGADTEWLERLDLAVQDGGWRGPGWQQHGTEAWAAVLHFVYEVLGARPDGAVSRLWLAPALPPVVSEVVVRGIRVGAASLTFGYRRTTSATVFSLMPRGGSTPLNVVMEPLVPYPEISRVDIDGRTADVDVEPRGDRTRLRFQLPLESTREIVVVPA